MNTITPNKLREAVSISAGVPVTHQASRPSLVPAISVQSDTVRSTSPKFLAGCGCGSGQFLREAITDLPTAIESLPSIPPNPNRQSPACLPRSFVNLAPSRDRRPTAKIATTRQQKSAHLIRLSVRRSDDEVKGQEDAAAEADAPGDGNAGATTDPNKPPVDPLNGGGEYCDIDGVEEQPIFTPPSWTMVGFGYAILSSPYLALTIALWNRPIWLSILLQVTALAQGYLLWRTDLTALLKLVIRKCVTSNTPPLSLSAFLRDSYITPQRSLSPLYCSMVPALQSLRLVFAPSAHAITGLLRKVAAEPVGHTYRDERLPSVQAVDASNVGARIDMWNCISPSTCLYTTILTSQAIVQQILSRVRALTTSDRDKLAESISARVVNVHIRASLLPDVQRGSAKLASARATSSDASDATIQTAHQLFQSRTTYFLLGISTTLIAMALKVEVGSIVGLYLFHVCLLAPIYEELVKTGVAHALGTARYIPSSLFGTLEFALFTIGGWASPLQRLSPLLLHLFVGTQTTARAIGYHIAYNTGCVVPLILMYLVALSHGPVQRLPELSSPQTSSDVGVSYDDTPFQESWCNQFAKECMVPPFRECRAFLRPRPGYPDERPSDCPAFMAFVLRMRDSEFCADFALRHPGFRDEEGVDTTTGKLLHGPLFEGYMCHPNPCAFLDAGSSRGRDWSPPVTREEPPLFCLELLGSSVAVAGVFLVALSVTPRHRLVATSVRSVCYACGYRVQEARLPPPGDHSAKITLTKRFFEPTPTRSDACSLLFTFRKFVPAFPDFSHPATALHGVLKRFCKTPPKPNARKIRSLRRFAERYVRKHYSPLPADVDASVETWLAATEYPDWRKKQLMECWLEKPWVTQDDFTNKSFIKREFYTDFKAARGINSRSDTFKCYSGPYFKLMEAQVYAQPCFDGVRLIPGVHNPFIKHIPCHLRPQFLTEMFEGFDGPFYETDYSEFEKHFTPEVMDALELVLYKHMLQNFPLVYDTIVAALRGTNRCRYNAFVVKIAARRMSGDMCTSLGNGFSNLILFTFVAASKGGTAFGVVEGDDALFKSTVPLQMEDFKLLGFDIKIMSHTFLHLTSFCGMSFSSDGILLRNPLRVMPKFGWTFSPRRLGGDATRMSLLRARALSLAYESPRCPIIHTLAKRSLELTHSSKPIFDSGYHNAEAKSWIERFPDVMRDQLATPPTQQAREEFASHFGISTAIQQRAEELISTWDGGPLDHPVIDLLFNHNSSLQSFAELYVNSDCEALIAQLEVNRQ